MRCQLWVKGVRCTGRGRRVVVHGAVISGSLLLCLAHCRELDAVPSREARRG